MKLKQLVESQPALQSILMISLPVKIAYKISKIVNLIKPELALYEEARTKLVKEMGEETDKEAQTWNVKPENLEKFQEELLALQDVEVPLNFGDGKEIEKIKIEELGDIQLAAGNLVALDWLFE